jgi:peptidyl-tRNA hydrolase, PTH1 family
MQLPTRPTLVPTSPDAGAHDQPWLVVGLGNPGEPYAGNRHNVGLMVIDVLTARLGGRLKSHRGRADILETHLVGQRAVLAKPHTFMNESGGPVAALTSFFGVPLGQLIVVHDELDIGFGALRIKQGGGDNGHNGLRSITKSLGGPDYLRVRFGIGRPPGRQDPAAFVLRDFATAERKVLGVHLERAADAVESLIAHGLAATQTTFNAEPAL